MNKRYSLPFILALLLLQSSGIWAADGGKLFLQNCGSCHGQSDTANGRLAPPVVAIKTRYLSTHTDKQAFVSALVNWVLYPSTDKSLMPGAVRRFGLMPALRYSKENLTAIAEYVYDENIDMPIWYEKHHKAEHGSGPRKPQ